MAKKKQIGKIAIYVVLAFVALTVLGAVLDTMEYPNKTPNISENNDDSDDESTLDDANASDNDDSKKDTESETNKPETDKSESGSGGSDDGLNETEPDIFEDDPGAGGGSEDQTPSKSDMVLKITDMTGSVLQGNKATVVIEGKVNTKYSIGVYYNSGASTAKGLEDKISDGNGVISWTWIIGARTKPGDYKIIISGGEEMITVYFTVLEN